MVINLDRSRKEVRFHGGKRLEPDSLDAILTLYGLTSRSARKGGGVETIDDGGEFRETVSPRKGR